MTTTIRTATAILALLATANVPSRRGPQDQPLGRAYLPPEPDTSNVAPRPGSDGGVSGSTMRDVAANPVSAFPIHVGTGSYATVRRILKSGHPVPASAVRTAGMINYFRYAYPRPAAVGAPFSLIADVSQTPWNRDTRLLRIGLRARDVDMTVRPVANLVFLIAMARPADEPATLQSIRTAIQGLAERLTQRDRVAIVVDAGHARILLKPTADKDAVAAALSRLQAGGAIAGGRGIGLAYATARAQFVEGGINRVVLTSAGNREVGARDMKALETLVARNRDDGITLTTLAFGDGDHDAEMMECIADAGNGHHAYIDTALEARRVFDEELSATLVTVAKDVKVEVEFDPASVRQYRLIGYADRARSGGRADDVGAGYRATALYEIVPVGAGDRTLPRGQDAGRTGGDAAFAHVALRYTLPGSGVRRTLDRPLPASLLTDAEPPTGDVAFVAAVAAYGQKLRGDPLLAGFGYEDIVRLAGDPTDYWRQEFENLVRLAAPPSAEGENRAAGRILSTGD